jgi:hypothetical protein
MSTEQLIKKKEENMILGSIKGMCVFLLFDGRPPLFLSLFLFIS